MSLLNEIIEALINDDIRDDGQFRSGGDGSTEVEYLALVAAWVNIYKPEHAIETGTARGHGTIAMLIGGAGHVDTVGYEIDAATRERVSKHGSVSFHQMKAEDYIRSTDRRYGFAFLDSSLCDRGTEFHLLQRLFTPSACCMIHDTSIHRPAWDSDSACQQPMITRVKAIADSYGWTWMMNNTGRGMMVLVR
jgi:predicted O-methyltransferase YrrM